MPEQDPTVEMALIRADLGGDEVVAAEEFGIVFCMVLVAIFAFLVQPLLRAGTGSVVNNFSGDFSNGNYGIDAGSYTAPAITLGGGSTVNLLTNSYMQGAINLGNATGSAMNTVNVGYSATTGVAGIDGDITAQGKPPEKLTADELDYMQKATGLVNTMANLSPAEKALYDKAVASGNTAAAAGISQIALVRMMGHTAGGAGGATYDPLNTAITAANVERYFSHSIVDPTGQAKAGFGALIAFLNADRVG